MTPGGGRFRSEQRPLFIPTDGPDYASNVVFEGAFTARQCDRIIETGLALGADDAQVGTVDDNTTEDAATRIAGTAWIEPSDDSMWIFDKLTSLAQRANRTWGFDLTGFTEDAQFTRYDRAGAFYDWHQDGLDGDVAVRKLSMVVQLSDPDSYGGSDLELFAVNEEHGADDIADWRARTRTRGTVVAFPAFEFHRVTPLLRGERFSLVCWIGGPAFR